VAVDAAQWPCPLWLGVDHLERALRDAHARWPRLADARHAATMTGEMVDLFDDRAAGVQRIGAVLAEALAPAPVALWAGAAGWCAAGDAARRWADVASANWLATATHAALQTDDGGAGGVLVDIGSTTTDLIAFRAGRVLTGSRGDADRLATGELVYHGVVRTPLCALAQRIGWGRRTLNVMNELFATTADVYRLTGELSPDDDQQPAADGGAKDETGTCRRLARMIGLDARAGSAADWRAFALAWRERQVDAIGAELARVMQEHGLCSDACVVAAGCGDFLVADVAARAGLHARPARYADGVARVAPSEAALARRAQVCAPALAVATLLLQEAR